jgi:hypothetical protein
MLGVGGEGLAALRARREAGRDLDAVASSSRLCRCGLSAMPKPMMPTRCLLIDGTPRCGARGRH